MKVNNIINKYITPRTTGYTAIAGMGLAITSGYSKNKSFKRMHKPLAIITVLAALIHVAQIEYSHYKWTHKKN